MLLITSPMLGITGGSQPLISYNYGAGSQARIRRIVLCVLLLCIGFTAFMFLVSRFLPSAFAGIFTKDPEYIGLSVWGIRAFTLMIIPLSFQYTFVDSLTALGLTKLSLSLSLFRKGLYFAATCLLPFAFGAASAFYAEPVADGVSFLTSTASWLIVYHRFLKNPGDLSRIAAGGKR